MKSVAKVAVCGILALALHNQANAQAAAISQEAMQMMSKNAVARQYLAEKLGVRTSSAADANVALKKLSAADQAAVLKAITAYTNNAVAGESAAAAASNMAAAKKAFVVASGSNIEVTAAAQGNTAPAAKGATCNMDDAASEVAAGTGFDKGLVYNLIQKKVINMIGPDCGSDIRAMKPENRRNLIFAADFAERKGVLSIQDPSQRDVLYGQGLAEAWRVNEGRSALDEAGGIESMKSIRAKCGYVF